MPPDSNLTEPYEGVYPVRSDEVDGERLRLDSLMLYLQDAAVHHASRLGYSIGDLGEQGLAWVLTRFRIAMEEYPGWGDTVRVQTWPSGVNRIFALRDYRVLSGSGVPIGRADSAWILMRIDTRRPVRLPAELASRLPLEVKRVFGDPVGQLEVDFDGESSREFEVRRADTDFNGHVNHARYVEWAVDGIPAEQRSGNIRSLEAEFKGEAVSGDRLRVDFGRSHQAANGLVQGFRFRRVGDGALLVLGRVGWRR